MLNFISVKNNSVKAYNSFDSYSLLLKMQNEPKWWLIFVKKFGKFWEVADFKDFVTNG